MDSILSVSHLIKKYKDFTLDDISFQIPRGAICGLIGENGAGKTTTISTVLNMVTPDSGSIQILGRDYLEGEKEIKQKVGVVIDGLNATLVFYLVSIVCLAGGILLFTILFKHNWLNLLTQLTSMKRVWLYLIAGCFDVVMLLISYFISLKRFEKVA